MDGALEVSEGDADVVDGKVDIDDEVSWCGVEEGLGDPESVGGVVAEHEEVGRRDLCIRTHTRR